MGQDLWVTLAATVRGHHLEFTQRKGKAMENLGGAFRAGRNFLLVCLFIVFSISSSAFAGTLFLSGDSTPAFFASDNDNNRFFENILQGGAQVVVHDATNSVLGNNLSNFYDSLAGVSSSYVGDVIVSAALLSGVNLFVSGLFSGGLDAGEVAAVNSFLASGGTALLMGEYVTPLPNINDTLVALGSGMSLYGDLTPIGTFFATGSQIAADPYTSGVNSFTYGYTYGVSGGKPLFFDENGRPFLAYEGSSAAIPEPITMLLLSSGLVGLLAARRRFKK